MSEHNRQKEIEPQLDVMGYVLRERIGVGGYGEVWSAEAPGGMLKAVKFIFGFHDEKRAQRELKALDRIKHIRHPFLLSLERIDIVDGRMVVISELAEMCLNTRFHQCVNQGLEGIDRDELLKYMSESADALDYIAESHSLAHLDIKPENLLLVGGHAKVADFGLVKDLQAVNQSLMDGLTPAYAAPELFDGQPGHASDQYSLAIVYQELLTGRRPFSGTTAAQLANQHLHSRPRLNDMPRGDQAVVARALAKSPAKRFPDCRSFVNELGKRRNRVRRKPAGTSVSPTPGVDTRDVTLTALDIQAARPNSTISLSESFSPAVKFESTIRKPDPLQIDESVSEIRPTLFIGVGHTGANILRRLRRRISTRFGVAEKTPSLRMLCLDVDRRSLFEATMGDDQSSLQDHEILDIPLRKPEEYRNDSQLDVSWIGRRWLYNIPKSLLTESLRPLGRLAYVDHHARIFQRMTDELSRLSEIESLATTSDTTGLLPSSKSPQVVFVGSVAGGVGSGMLLDLAYSTRVCMGELGMVDDHLFGMFSHSTSRDGIDHRLAIANSCSFLGEMYHYNLNGFPGNEACGIPSFDDETPVFDGTYFVHLGDDLRTEDYRQSVDGMAEYLFLSTCTRCNHFFDICRDSSEYEAGMLKTMGISSVCRGHKSLSEVPSDRLIESLLGSWLDSPDTAEHHSQVENTCDSILAQTFFAGENLATQIVTVVRKHLGDNPVTELLTRIPRRLQHRNDVDPPSLNDILDLLVSELGEPGTEPVGEKATAIGPNLCIRLNVAVATLARKFRDDVGETVLPLIDHGEYRVIGAQRITERICDRLRELESGLDDKRSQLRQQIDSAAKRLEQETKAVRDKDGGEKRQNIHCEATGRLVADYLHWLIESYKRKLVVVARQELTSTLDRITSLHQTLDLIRSELRLPVNVDDMYEQPEKPLTLHDLMESYAVERSRGLMTKLNARIEQQILQPEGGLRAILDAGGSRVRVLPGLMKREAENLICQQLKELQLDSLMAKSSLPPETIATWISQLVDPVMPLLFRCGGTSRLLIAIPQNAPVATIATYIQHHLDHEANIIPSTFGDFVITLEMDQLPSEYVAMNLLQMQPDCAELIERLHSRNDVEWSSFTPMG